MSFLDSRRHDRFLVNAHWLMRLRWVAVAGQLATVAFVAGVLRVPLSLLPLMAIIGVTIVTNTAFFLWLRRSAKVGQTVGPERGHWLLAAIMGLDLLALTGLLYFSGGPSNPFTIFYFVNLALSAVILPARWGWTLTGLAMVCLTLLFFEHQRVPELEGEIPTSGRSSQWTIQQQGLLVSLAACPCIVIYFITRVTRELQQREAELREVEQKRARSERLEALGTLAAGAGHELATPLSTIAVIAKELTRHLEDIQVPDLVRDDVAQIRREVDICRSILNRMRGGVGLAAGEPVTQISSARLLNEVLGGLHDVKPIDFELLPESREIRLRLPVQSVAQAVRGVIQNAIDASPTNSKIRVRVTSIDAFVHIEVQDWGNGMSNDVLQRVGEPFFTTKEPGKGMGLGLFLTRSVLDRIGGRLHLQSHPGAGTTALILLPSMPAE